MEPVDGLVLSMVYMLKSILEKKTSLIVYLNNIDTVVEFVDFFIKSYDFYLTSLIANNCVEYFTIGTKVPDRAFINRFATNMKNYKDNYVQR
jgi:hypothetical protein